MERSLLFALFQTSIVLVGLYSCDVATDSESDPEIETATHVTGITLDQKQVTIKEGASLKLTTTVYPEDATNKRVNWSSTDDSIATVEDGNVTGIKAGSAIITVTTEDGGKTATCAITVESNLAPSVTVGTDHLSAVSVVLMGKANLGTVVSSDLKIGFQYSKSAGILPANSTTVDATEADSDYNFSTIITGLNPETTYYYRSFVRQNGIDTYGETKEFTTQAVTSLLCTLDATDVEADKACLNSKLDLTDVQCMNLEYGFYWGASKDSQNNHLKGGEITDNVFSSSLSNLSHQTQYWYKSYAVVDSQTFYGEVKSFTTGVVSVESVSLENSEYTINAIGSSIPLYAIILPLDATDKSVEWTSDKEDVATVDKNGRVKAIDNGEATITVMTKDQGKTAACKVTVAQRVTRITLNETSITLNEGQTATLSISTIHPDKAVDKSVTWTSSDNKVATVDAAGKVTAISKGSATIQATANDGSGIYAGCAISVKRLVSNIILDKTTISLFIGESKTLEATVFPSTANNTSITWSSSNTSIATVSSSGLVSGKTYGNATITARAKDGSGVKATCEVEVKQYVTSITLEDISLAEGHTQTLTATVNPSHANDQSLSWTSSDTSIATVDNSGEVTAKSIGTATIKAIANDGSGTFAECFVHVFKCPKSVDLGIVVNGKTIKWANLNLGASTTEGYGLYYAWGEMEPKEDYSWSNYIWCNGSSNSITKYNTSSSYGTVDNRIVLEPEDDVAHVKLGGKWRMPTDEEWTELRTKCTLKMVTQNSVNGHIVTGPNGNSIFLPATGYRKNTNLDGDGTRGYYWSSSLYTDSPYCTWYVKFYYSNIYVLSSGTRCYGLSIRPVTE